MYECIPFILRIAGFQPSKAFFAESKPLGKVEEEADVTRSDNTVSRGDTVKSTVESIDETEVSLTFPQEKKIEKKAFPDPRNLPKRARN